VSRVPVFPQVARGKPLLAITNEEMEVAISDAEEAYVFLSGLDRDLVVSDYLQGIRAHRKSNGVRIVRSRLVIQNDVWEFPGPTRQGFETSGYWKGHAYACILPNNEIIMTDGGAPLRWGPAVRFLTPASGYYIEIEGDFGYETTSECIQYESFHPDRQIEASLNNVPFGQFNDLD